MLKKLLSASVLTLSMVAFAGAGTAEDITVVSWGGAYTKSQVEAYHKPYTAKTGVNVLSTNYNGGLAEIKSQVETGNVTWDVVDVEVSDAVRGCDEGLLEPLADLDLPSAPDGTPASSDFMEGSLMECAVGTIVWSRIFAYNTDVFSGSNKPTKIADLFDTKRFPGKRGLQKDPKSNLEIALMADGVPNNQVYAVLSTPAGVERAFAKLDTVRDDVVWWEAGAQPPQLLADGEVVMTTAYNGRIFNAVEKEKQPFEIVWDGQIQDLDVWVVPMGTKNPKLARDFIKLSTSTQALADQARWISYGPVRLSSLPLISTSAASGVDMAPHMPTAEANAKNALLVDHFFWADYSEEMEQRFASWLAQ